LRAGLLWFEGDRDGAIAAAGYIGSAAVAGNEIGAASQRDAADPERISASIGEDDVLGRALSFYFLRAEIE